jgi:hypothetical protein
MDLIQVQLVSRTNITEAVTQSIAITQACTLLKHNDLAHSLVYCSVIFVLNYKLCNEKKNKTQSKQIGCVPRIKTRMLLVSMLVTRTILKEGVCVCMDSLGFALIL